MQSDEVQIRQLVETWLAATKAGDTGTVLSLMADDVVFLIAGRPPMVGKAAFAEASKTPPGGEPPQFDGTSEIQEIQVSGRLGLYVDQAQSRGDAARRFASHASRAYAVGSQKGKRPLAAGPRCEHAVLGAGVK